jgi:hypothetical protein
MDFLMFVWLQLQTDLLTQVIAGGIVLLSVAVLCSYIFPAKGENMYSLCTEKKTRKEDLNRWLRGQLTLEEYLDLHRDEPEDGSLTNSYPCLHGSHPGQRVGRDRLRTSPVSGKLEVYQPQAGEYITPNHIEFRTYPCCDRKYVWVTEVNGKVIHG